MWWLLLTTCFWLQTNPVTGTEEYWGEGTVSEVRDWHKARQTAQAQGLEMALTECWNTRAVPSLFLGISPAETGRIRKIVFQKKDSFLIGLSSIQENRLGNGQYTFRALYQLDASGFLREIKRLLLFNKLQTLHVHTNTSDPSWVQTDLTQALSRPGLHAVFKTDKLPEHCPVDFCLEVTNTQGQEGFEAGYLLRTTRSEQPPKPRKGPKPKPILRTTTETFTWVATARRMLFLQLPNDLAARLGISQAITVQVQASGSLDFSTWMQVLFLLTRQDPEILSLRTVGFLSGRNTAIFQVRPSGNGRDVLFKSSFLGKNVKVAWKKRPDGVWELDLQLPEKNPEEGTATP